MRRKAILVCDICLSRNYSIEKNTAATERLVLKKFCPVCNQHTVHKETR